MPISTENDRRIFDRFPARFPVKFKDTRDGYGQNVFLKDASASGVNIVTRERMYFNDSVSLEVELPDGSFPMHLKGRVMWTKPINASMWDVGIKFDEVRFMMTQRLFKFSPAS